MSARPDPLIELALEVEQNKQQRDFVDLMVQCYHDPLLFFREVLMVEPRKWQREALEEIRDRRLAGEAHTRMLIRASHTSGKTWLSAGLVLWWQTTRPGARTLTTAPNNRLVETLLWTEIRKMHAQSRVRDLGRMLNVAWLTGGEKDPTWFALGASSDRPEGLEGQHSLYMARIVDEAKAVEDRVFTATQGAFFGSVETLDIWISTPAARIGKFYERDIKGGPELVRKVVTIEDLIASGMPGAERAKQEAIEEYGGEDNFEYRSRAMAEYIDTAEGLVFKFSWIERAMLTDAEREAQGLPRWRVPTPPTLGFDIAGSVAGDENAIAAVHGPDSAMRYEVREVRHWHENDTMISKDRAFAAIGELKARCIRGDVQGLGKPVLDAIRRDKALDSRLTWWIEEYRSADPAEDPERFLNKKAENTWELRRLLEQDRIRLPKDAKLRSQMASIKYEVRNGKIKILDPDDSPDLWDAVLMGVGGVYHSVKREDVGGGGANAWGPVDKDAGWSRAPGSLPV